MGGSSINVCKMLSEALDPEQLQRNFLSALLDLQNVERGSIWVKRDDGYHCVEAMGNQSEKIKGITISTSQPSIVGWVIENGERTVAEPQKDARHFKELEEDLVVKSRLILCFPLLLKSGEVYGAVQIIDTGSGGTRLNLSQEYLQLIQDIVDIGSIALSNSLIHAAQLRENQVLKQTIEAMRTEDAIVGRSENFLKILKVAADYAGTDFPVLITGESGTGKELIAREIHRLSKRKEKPFLVQNCSAIPESLLESELFGYVKGAFTGAVKDKVGIFEAANSGTLFLDEIGDMPFHLQASLLRVIQNSEIKPVGGTRTKIVDVRIISATNKDLGEAIAKEQFREDLFYRLNVLPIHIPALRERREDIPLLLEWVIRMESLKMGIQPKKIAGDAMEFLVNYQWKGNVRELENFVKRIIVVAEGNRITLPEISPHFISSHGDTGADNARAASRSGDEQAGPGPVAIDSSGKPSFEGYTWADLEKAYVLYLLEKNKWHVTHAAMDAGVNRSTFDSRMKKLGIRR